MTPTRVIWYRAASGHKHAYAHHLFAHIRLCDDAITRPEGRPCSRPGAADRCEGCHQAARKLGR